MSSPNRAPFTLEASRARKQPPTGKTKSIAGGIIALVLSLILAGFFTWWHFRLQDRRRLLSVELSSLEQRRAMAAVEAAEAQDAQMKIVTALSRIRSAEDEIQSTPRWAASALQSVTSLFYSHIELTSFEAIGELPESMNLCEMRIHGVATGREPRLTADLARQRLHADLANRFQQAQVGTAFERLEETPLSNADSEGASRVTFVITARIAPE